MAKRPSLRANVTKPEAAAKAAEAAKLAERLGAGQAKDGAVPTELVPGTDPDMAETVSFHLPLWMTDGLSELAALRLRRDKMNRRAAIKAGERPPQARRSASAIVREALEARWGEIEAETEALRKELGGRR